MRVRGWKSRIAFGAVCLLAGGTGVMVHGHGRPEGGGAALAHASLAAAAQSWTVYHGDALGSGADTSGVSFASPPAAAWPPVALDGDLYGEPLEATGRVFVATENNTVYAIAANTGAVLWSTNLGTPVPYGEIPCSGNIKPTVGITGTPVIDEARGEIFVVSDDLVAGPEASHHLVGLNIYTGNIELNQAINLPGSDQLAQLQRTGLNLSNGNVVMGFGGNAGDCGTYHGWVVAIPEGGGTQLSYEVDRATGQSRGAIWMGGAAPEVDASGNIWAAAGNGSVTSSTSAYDFSDSVFELSPTLTLKQYFAPSSWASDNNSDADLGSSSPAMVNATGSVLQVGKSHTAYRLSQTDLGGVNGPNTSITACSSNDVDGGHVVSGTIVYVPCRSGLQAIQTGTTFNVLWSAASGAGDPPILAGGDLWSIKGGTGTMYAINPSNGATVTSVSVGGEANSFATPSVGDGLLLAPSTTHLYGFVGSAGLPGPPAPPPPPPPNSSYWLVAADGGVFSFNAPFYGSEGGKPLNAPVVAMAPTPGHGGYWMVASDGGVFSFGDARFFGSEGGKRLDAPVVGMAATPSGHGYWLVASDGGVFSFGDAQFYGSEGGKHLNAPVVGMAANPSGGYWLVASDGGIFSFGAPFEGSMGGRHLNAPVVGMAAGPSGGYWLVASDGGVFSFGAPFEGSMGGRHLNAPMVGMAPTPSGAGYWQVASDGGIFTFGDANFGGSEGASPLNKPVVGMASAS